MKSELIHFNKQVPRWISKTLKQTGNTNQLKYILLISALWKANPISCKPRLTDSAHERTSAFVETEKHELIRSHVPSLLCQKYPSFSFSHKTPSLSNGIWDRLAMYASSFWLNLISMFTFWQKTTNPPYWTLFYFAPRLPETATSASRHGKLVRCHKSVPLYQPEKLLTRVPMYPCHLPQ